MLIYGNNFAEEQVTRIVVGVLVTTGSTVTESRMTPKPGIFARLVVHSGGDLDGVRAR